MNRRAPTAFTLLEMLAAISVLGLIVIVVSSLFNSASNITSTGSKRMDVDSELRLVFTRMSVDIAKLVKRADLASHAKAIDTPQNGNDLLAFYSLVDGFFPVGITAEKRQPQTTIVSYRVGPSFQFQRMAKSLAFAGQHASRPLLFGTGNALETSWPTATDATATDPDYSVVAAGVFRFEYYYVLKSNGSTSAAPWPTIADINFADVAAIAVNIAAVDPKSRALLSDASLEDLIDRMADYDAGMGTNGLMANWQSAVNSTANAPRSAVGNIRLYQRIFPL